MGFPVKLLAIKGNLVFMSNLYHKCSCVCLHRSGFVIGARKEAKAATFNSFFPYPLITFQAYDGGLSVALTTGGCGGFCHLS
jgi:hypothetical protein